VKLSARATGADKIIPAINTISVRVNASLRFIFSLSLSPSANLVRQDRAHAARERPTLVPSANFSRLQFH
jgi:hypothetical protein